LSSLGCQQAASRLFARASAQGELWSLTPSGRRIVVDVLMRRRVPVSRGATIMSRLGRYLAAGGAVRDARAREIAPPQYPPLWRKVLEVLGMYIGTVIVLGAIVWGLIGLG
jgi:hypothetical protein